MIKNIWKSWITTTIGILFALVDMAYIFVKDSPDWKILVTIASICFIFIFMSDSIAKDWLKKAGMKIK